MSTNARSSIKILNAPDVGPVELTVDERGDGQPFLLLHGGAGPQSMAAMAELLAETDSNQVMTPTHPGFGGTTRPDSLRTAKGLAALYSNLLDSLGLEGVTIIGNSVDGWVAAEMGVLGSPRIRSIVLLDAVGIEVEGHAVADVSGLSVSEIQALSFTTHRRSASIPPR
jgi:pimeloyl-ACP methyl ester carboxylesterase